MSIKINHYRSLANVCMRATFVCRQEVGMNPDEKPSGGLRDVALQPVKWVFGSLRSMWHSLKNFKAAISSTKNVIVDKYRGVKKGDANQTD